MNAYMQGIVNWLIETTWQASLLSLFVIGVQFLFYRTLTARWRYLLWAVVIARLLLPVLPESPTSIYRYIPTADNTFTTEIIRQPATLTLPPVNNAQLKLSSLPKPTLSNPGLYSTPSTFYISPDIKLFLIWLSISLLLTVTFVTRNYLFFRRISSLASPASPHIQILADQARAMHKIKLSIPVRELDHLDSPAIVGLFRPIILLPKNLPRQLTDAELSVVFYHELAHLKRGDLWVNLLCCLLQIVHWFNPVLWWAFARMRHDRELATDALAMSIAKNTNREHYGQILIKLSANNRPSSVSTPGIGILENHKGLHQRIQQIARLKPNAYAWSFFGIVLILVIGALCLTKFTPEKLPPLSNELSIRRDMLSAMQRLVAQNDLEGVHDLLQRGLDPGLNKDIDYVSPAIQNDNNKMLELLFQHGATIPDKRRSYIYSLALGQANRQIVNTLIANGCQFDPFTYAAAFGEIDKLQQIEHSSPQTREQLITALCTASAAGQTTTTDYLFQKCQPLNDSEKKRLVHATAERGRLSALQHLEKLQIPITDYTDEILGSAVYLNKPEILSYLFSKGAKPSQDTLIQNLNLAATWGKLEAAEVLLAHGADPNKATPGWARYPIISVAFSRFYTAEFAQTEESAYNLTQLLLKYGANADVRTEDNQSAAWLATTSPKVLKLLLEHGASVSGTDTRGSTIIAQMIHVPAASPYSGASHTPQELRQIDQNYQTVINLLAKAKVDINQPNAGGSPPLIDAIRTGNYAIAIALIENGAHINVTDQEGNSPLTLAASLGFSVDPNEQLFKLLIDKGADPNSKLDPSGFRLTPIKTLAHSISGEYRPLETITDSQLSSIQNIIKLLLAHGSHISNNNNPRTEKWLQAAANGDLATLKRMHDDGQSIDTADSDNWTALILSLALQHRNITQWLVDNGTNLTIAPKDGLDSPLSIAVAQNNLELVKRMLNAGIKPEPGVLDIALRHQDKIIFHLLLESGFPPDADSIYQCIVYGDPESARLLFEHGAPAESNGNAEHRENVYWAIGYNQPEILKLILDHGGDPLRKTIYNETPLGKAKQSHPAMVPILEAAIAKWNMNDKADDPNDIVKPLMQHYQ